MSLNEYLNNAIDWIRKNHCKPCRSGKCIEQLEALLDEQNPSIPEQNADKSERKPAAIDTKPARAKTNRSKRETKEPSAETDANRKCNGCGKVKPIDEFPRNKTCKGGYAGTCKQCNYDRAKKHAAKKNGSPKGNGNNGKRLSPASSGEKKIPLDVIAKVEVNEDGLYGCPVLGCDAELRSMAAWELHYRTRHL